jgi:3-hydroxyacyl-CoA dehydrogenase/enoyl-CoA hydratase/3-hydroxybutyryl-CoA epimerase
VTASFEDWKFRIDREGIAWAVFDRSGESANSLGRRPLEELGRIVADVEAAARAGTIKGLVFISGKEKGFIVGADIREFDGLDDETKVRGAIAPVLDLLDRIERLPVPVVAAIHGACVGGGLELALACHWRIATRDDGTRLGFPEVKLGIFPGFNGTARAIRQAGPLAGMQAMLTGSLARPSRARAMNFVDELVPSRLELPWAARKAILRKRRSRPAGWLQQALRQWPVRSLIANRMRAATAKKVREEHYPAPFRLIDLFEQSGGDLDSLKARETNAFIPLMLSDTSRNLRRLFRLSELLKSEAPKSLAWTPLRVHVIGAGTMGADIAGWCAASGFEVTLQDLSADQIAKGIAAQAATLDRKFKTKPEREAARLRLVADPDGHGVGRADVVIEAIVENLEIKQKLFLSLESRLKRGAVLATNTSSLMIEDIARPLADQGRLVGIHFFNPVARMPLVEVVRGAGTREEDVRKAAAFVARLDKLPLVVRSVPGFLVNRVLAPYMFEAMQRLEQGDDKERIDEAARTFGMPMGPIELADTVGLDVCLHVGRILLGAGENSRLAEMVKAGKLGKKSGEGFYVWKKGRPEKSDKPLDKAMLDKLGRELVEPLITGAEKARDEAVVASADHVDAGLVFGAGFAPFRGGPLHYRASERAAPARLVAAA